MSRGALASRSFIKLVVRDLHKQAAFYEFVCGYGEGQFLEASIGDRLLHEILFIREDGEVELILLNFPEGSGPSPTGVIVGFYAADLAGLESRVLAAGGHVVQPIEAIEHDGENMCIGYYADPEGFMLEVIQRC